MFDVRNLCLASISTYTAIMQRRVRPVEHDQPHLSGQNVPHASDQIDISQISCRVSRWRYALNRIVGQYCQSLIQPPQPPLQYVGPETPPNQIERRTEFIAESQSHTGSQFYPNWPANSRSR